MKEARSDYKDNTKKFWSLYQEQRTIMDRGGTVKKQNGDSCKVTTRAKLTF